MKILYQNSIEEIKNIIQHKAKYQKVMLLFDDFVSNLEITEIYEAIKNHCVYNQQNIEQLDKQEIYNGYRLIIYCCSIDNFIKSSFDRSEFINIFFSKDDAFLPYFLNENNKPSKEENYLLINGSNIDLSVMSSVYLNMFYNYFKHILLGEKVLDFPFSFREITQQNILSYMENLNKNIFFLDIDILKKQNISYKELVVLDLMLIDAFLLLISGVKNQNLMIVDVYKTAKDDLEILERFYKFYKNENFVNLILLNYNCLLDYCLKTKEKILELIMFFEIDYTKLDSLFTKLKLYAKNDKELMGYLFLYNFFSV